VAGAALGYSLSSLWTLDAAAASHGRRGTWLLSVEALAAGRRGCRVASAALGECLSRLWLLDGAQNVFAPGLTGLGRATLRLLGCAGCDNVSKPAMKRLAGIGREAVPAPMETILHRSHWKATVEDIIMVHCFLNDPDLDIIDALITTGSVSCEYGVYYDTPEAKNRSRCCISVCTE